MDDSDVAPSVNQRCSNRLAPLVTSLSAPGDSLSHDPGIANPLASIKRQSSKSGLRALFGKTKAVRRSSPGHGLAHVDEVCLSSPLNAEDMQFSPETCTTPKTAASSSIITASPIALHQKKVPPLRRVEADEVISGNGDLSRKPPPLFQAYPQAIKYDCLDSPVLSADSILRIHAATKRNSREGNDYASQWQSRESSTAKRKDNRKRHIRSLSDAIGKADWTRKIYVLATSGYILQYAGDGKHDRLPEKILRLGPNSVAFASDAIPGRHWVLQVSHSTADGEVGPEESSNSLFSRLAFHRSYPRRLARGFLMVFSSPEELSSWLLAVRAEIEARGGKKYVSEQVFNNNEDSQLRPEASTRKIIVRDPNRFSNVFLQPQQLDLDNDHLAQGSQSRRSSYQSFNRRSLVMESRSDTLSTGQADIQVEQLCPPAGAPVHHSSLPDGSCMEPQNPLMPGMNQRQSLLIHSRLGNADEGPDSSKVSPTVYPIVCRTSPPAPNFSVPSFSKRFAARTSEAQISQAPHSGIRPDEDDTSIATFPSPSQSPERGLDRKELIEHHLQPVRGQLRISNSDLSLRLLCPEAQGRHDSGAQAERRAAKQPIIPSFPNPAPNCIDSSLRWPQASNAEGSGVELVKSRASKAYQGSSPLGPSRRRSMPGLAGPPVAPPPNCPLPEIPLPATAASGPRPEYSATRSPPQPSSSGRTDTLHTVDTRAVPPRDAGS